MGRVGRQAEERYAELRQVYLESCARMDLGGGFVVGSLVFWLVEEEHSVLLELRQLDLVLRRQRILQWLSGSKYPCQHI